MQNEQVQLEEVIIVYPNRHFRAQNPKLNDMRQLYISQRAMKTLVNLGYKLKFIKKVVSYQEVTAEMLLKLENKQLDRPTKSKRIKEDFDPYDRRRA